MNREQWLIERRNGIGGSDAAAICGLSKWTTRLDVYEDKLGLREDAQNEAMEWGNLLEPVIRQKYAASRADVHMLQPYTIVRHPVNNWMFATVDGLVGHDGILEVKTARTSDGWGEPGTDEVPDWYLPQIQHYLAVFQRQFCDVAVLIGGQDYRVYTLYADKDMQESLIALEAEFWDRIVRRDPPEPETLEEAKRRWRKSVDKGVQASERAISAAHLLADAKSMAKRVEKDIEAFQAMLCNELRDSDTLMVGDKVLATWKQSKPSRKFDEADFRAQYPELHAEFTREVEGSRRFLLKASQE